MFLITIKFLLFVLRFTEKTTTLFKAQYIIDKKIRLKQEKEKKYII